ncbi:winged helix-turn-helix domain-containing protein [Paraburkholderia caribensis]|uniref:winged helix-turn-helix domain-containing protein n=1 Tax=Paraburkholderia caribensis TaxID=75105 RepID=UPI0034D30B2B
MENLSRERIIVFGPFRLNPTERALYAGTEKLDIRSRTFDVLLALVTHPDQVVTHSMFNELIWPGAAVEDVNLRVQIAHLRRMFEKHHTGYRCIESVPGRGYRFVGKVIYEERLLGITDRGISLGIPQEEFVEGNDFGALIGRWPDLTAIERLLSKNRLVTIVGPGGVGKTSLALAAMRNYCAARSINAICVELSSVASEDMVASALASALGVVAVVSSPIEATVSALRGKRIFLMIDCCEHLMGGVTRMVETIQRNCDGVTVLATSREPLRAHDEWVYRLQPLATPNTEARLSCDDAFQYASVRLFLARAKSAIHGFSLTAENVAEVCALCLALDGLPLAIELAAARLEIFEISDLLAAIDQRLGLLTRGRRTDLPRHQTLRSTIDWSYNTLSDMEKMALRRVSIFKGSFTLDQASALLDDSVASVPNVVSVFGELVDKSLIVAGLYGMAGTFRLLDSTREYGLEKLAGNGELSEVARSHAQFFCLLFTEPATFRPPDDALSPLATDRRILDDVRSALTWAFSNEGMPSIGIALTWSCAPLFYQLSLFDEYRERVKVALKFIRRATTQEADADADAEYRLQLAYAQADYLTQDLERGVAPRAFQYALALAEKFNDRARQFQTLYGTIIMTVRSGEYDEAAELNNRLLTLTDAHPDGLALYHRLATLIQTQRGKLALASRHAHDALRHASAKETSLRRDLTRYALRPAVLAHESRVLWLTGFSDDAVEVAAKSVAEAIQLNHKLSICCAVALGACSVTAWTGDIVALRGYLDILEPLTDETSLINWQGQAQCFKYAFPGHEPGSSKHYWDQFERLAPSTQEILATVNGRFLTPAVIDRAKSGKAGYATAEILRALGDNLLATGRAACSVSEDLYRSAIAVARQQGTTSWELRAATSLAKLKHRAGEFHEAEDLLHNAMTLIKQGHSTRDYRAATSLLEEIRRLAA